MDNIFDTVRHPANAPSILNWILQKWDDDPSSPLLIIVHESEGEALDNRLRVRLANARKSLRATGERNIKQFGIESRVISWTTLTGRRYEALCVTRVIHVRHQILMAMSKVRPVQV